MDTRSSDPNRVINALLQSLDTHAGPAPGLARVHGTAVIRDGRAMLVPNRLREQFQNLDRRLRARGVLVVDAPLANLDLKTAEVVIQQQMTVDRAPLDEALAGVPCRRRVPAVKPGRYPLVRWLFVDFWREGVGGEPSFSRATAVRRASLTTVDEIRPGKPPLEELGRLFESVEAVGVDPQSPGELLDLVTDFPS